MRFLVGQERVLCSVAPKRYCRPSKICLLIGVLTSLPRCSISKVSDVTFSLGCIDSWSQRASNDLYPRLFVLQMRMILLKAHGKLTFRINLRGVLLVPECLHLSANIRRTVTSRYPVGVLAPLKILFLRHYCTQYLASSLMTARTLQ